MPPKRKKTKKAPQEASTELPDEVQEQLETLLAHDGSTDDGIKRIRKALGKEMGIKLSESEIREVFDPDDRLPLRNLVASAYLRNEKADQCFSLLDEANKGVVVIQDLQRVAKDILGEDVTDEDLQEMIDEFDRSGDGLLMREDFYRIARKVNL